jgi:Protein of unknown function (DUF3011)/Peptidase inhibitor family I36
MKAHAKLLILLLGLIFAILFLPQPASAQASSVQSVTCESNNGNRKYCGSYTRDQVTFQRQLSNSSCVQGQSWGVDRQGLWVDRGCRAIFSVVVVVPGPGWIHPGPGNPWPPSGDWNGGRWGKGGACFYKGYDFSGDYFCMRRGESRDSLGDYGGKISSIRVFGGARVVVFNNRNFSGGQDVTDRDIRDLRRWKMSTNYPHTWNNRISSLQVR